MRCSVMCVLVLAAASALAQGISVQKLSGDVRVRHGVTEQWASVAVGDVLKPEDTMMTGIKGTAVVLAPESRGTKRITLPPDVIVDIADIRDLTAEELMLKLAMEKVRGSSYRSSEDPTIPNAAVVHGANREATVPLTVNDAAALPLWNGARVLFENGFYSTCALKGMELLRLYPPFSEKFDCRFLVAQSLEKTNLRGEALNEYSAILQMPGLTKTQEASVQQHITLLQR